MKQVSQKHNLYNKRQKIEIIYWNFNNSYVELTIEMSEMEEFEMKYYETISKLQDQQIPLSVCFLLFNYLLTYFNFS